MSKENKQTKKESSKGPFQDMIHVKEMFNLASSPFLWVLRGPAAQKGCPTPAGRRWSDWPCGRWGPSTGSPESWADHPAHRLPTRRRSPCSSWSLPRRRRPLLRPHSPPLLPHSPPLLLGPHLQPQLPLPLPTKVQRWLCYSITYKKKPHKNYLFIYNFSCSFKWKKDTVLHVPNL